MDTTNTRPEQEPAFFVSEKEVPEKTVPEASPSVQNRPSADTAKVRIVKAVDETGRSVQSFLLGPSSHYRFPVDVDRGSTIEVVDESGKVQHTITVAVGGDIRIEQGADSRTVKMDPVAAWNGTNIVPQITLSFKGSAFRSCTERSPYRVLLYGAAEGARVREAPEPRKNQERGERRQVWSDEEDIRARIVIILTVIASIGLLIIFTLFRLASRVDTREATYYLCRN